MFWTICLSHHLVTSKNLGLFNLVTYSTSISSSEFIRSSRIVQKKVYRFGVGLTIKYLSSISPLLERNETCVWTYLQPFCYLSDRACKHKQDLLSTSALSKSSIGVFFSWLLQLLLQDFRHVLQFKKMKDTVNQR